MIGDPDKNDRNFTPDHYEDFYENHHFEPIPEEAAFDVHEIIPRFGWAFDQVEELAPKNLLDLGCLDGSFANTIAAHLPVDVYGVDLTQDGIELAMKRSHKKGLRGTFYQGSIEYWLEEFAKQDLKFDVVTWFEIIEHVEDVQKVIKLIDAVLSPGGTVLCSTPSYESPLYGADDEGNKCHVRLYTTKEKSYEAPNKFGTVRKATSIYEEIGKDRIKEVGIANHLINFRYQ